MGFLSPLLGVIKTGTKLAKLGQAPKLYETNDQGQYWDGTKWTSLPGIGGDGGGGGTPSFASTEGGMRTQAELDAQAAEAAWQRQLQLEALRQANQVSIDKAAAEAADARQQRDFVRADAADARREAFTIEQSKLANEQAILLQSKDFENAYKLKIQDNEFTTQRDVKMAEARAKEFSDTQALERERMAASKEEGQADRAASLQRAQMEISAAANRSAAEIAAQKELAGLRIAADRAMQGERIAADTKQLLIQIGATKENTLLNIASSEKIATQKITADKESQAAQIAADRQRTFVEMLGKDPIRAVLFAMGVGPEADQFNAASQAMGQALPPLKGAQELAASASKALTGTLQKYGGGTGTDVTVGQQGVQNLGTPELAARAITQGGADVQTLLGSAFGVGTPEAGGLSTARLGELVKAVVPKGVLG